jgi:hypothetical protein
VYQALPGVLSAATSPEAQFLEACSATPSTERAEQIARSLASCIREVIELGSIAPLRDALSQVRSDSSIEVADLLAAAAFSIQDELLGAGAPDLPARVRRINCIIRDVQYGDQAESKDLTGC